jgi:hypothetical protein
MTKNKNRNRNMSRNRNSASLKELKRQVKWNKGSGKATLEVTTSLMKELLDGYEASNQLVEDYQAYYGDLPTGGRRDFKDTCFRFIFNRPEWALDLYNALRGTDHRDPSEIEFTTIGDFLFMGMRNDVSFFIGSELMLWEHQSTYSPNLPVRIIPYLGAAFGKYLSSSGIDYYGTELKPIPVPLCYCFYNGEQKRPKTEVLKLSDAYNINIDQLKENGLEWRLFGKDLLEGADASVEIKVVMVNVNHDENRDLLEACKPLEEYSWLVAKVRENKGIYNDLGVAINEALEAMPEDFVIRGLLMDHRKEVYNMLYGDFDKQTALRVGAEDARIEFATKLIRRGQDSAEEISGLVDMPIDEVKRLAGKLKATLPLG